MLRHVAVTVVLLLARVVCAAGPASAPSAPLTLWLPGHSWALSVDGTYQVTEHEVAPGGKAARFLAEDRKSGVMVSAFIEPATREGDATVVRETFLKRLEASPMRPADIQRWEESPLAMAQFTTKLGDFADFRQTSVHVYAVREDHWIDVHLSTMDPRMHEKLRGLTGTVHFIDDYQPSDEDRHAANAPIRRLEAALTDTLTPAQWKQLAVKIAVAYGESGQVRRAREILQKGQARYPDYPLFYYNLACAEAQEGNADAAVTNLRMAWQNRSRLLPDESLPDPLRDSSFTAILKDRRVRNAVVDIVNGR